MSVAVGIFSGSDLILPIMNTILWPVFQELSEGKSGDNVVGQNLSFYFTLCALCFSVQSPFWFNFPRKQTFVLRVVVEGRMLVWIGRGDLRFKLLFLQLCELHTTSLNSLYIRSRIIKEFCYIKLIYHLKVFLYRHLGSCILYFAQLVTTPPPVSYWHLWPIIVFSSFYLLLSINTYVLYCHCGGVLAFNSLYLIHSLVWYLYFGG